MIKSDQQYLRSQIGIESNFHLSEEAFARLIEKADEITVKKGKPIVGSGSHDASLYIIKKGICRVAYVYEDKEVTFGFGETGTCFISPSAFCLNKGAYFQMLACTDSTCLRISKSDIDDLMVSCNEIARWLFNTALFLFYNCEAKLQVWTGKTPSQYTDMLEKRDIERYKSLKLNHPDILNVVPDKIVASYLGISHTHFSYIKGKALKGK